MTAPIASFIARTGAVVMALALPSVQSLAQPTPAYADIEPFMEALFGNMSVAFQCRGEVGDSPYVEARALAANGLAKYVGLYQAKAAVDQMHRKLEADEKATGVPATPGNCQDRITKARNEVNVERAVLEAGQ